MSEPPLASMVASVSAAPTYPVIWSEPGEEPANGRLVADLEVLRLQGSRNGRLAERTLAYADLSGVRIGRTAAERVNAQPTLVLDQHDTATLLVSPLGPGLLHELADLLAGLCERGTRIEKLAVILPLRPDALEAARSLLAEGPPFDPADVELGRHEVFLDGEGAIFVFSGADACRSVREMMRDPSVWRSADRWAAHLAAPPRLAEVAYSWPPLG